MYTWQQPEWPTYHYDLAQHQAELVRLYGQAERLRGSLDTLPRKLSDVIKTEAYADEGLANAAVEGEHYLRDHIRSSTLVALGLADASALKGNRKALAIGRLSIVAMLQANDQLTEHVLHGFHKLALGDDEDPRVGTWRINKRPLYVISGAIGQEEIHFEAPPHEQVPAEMETFLTWYNRATGQSIHPERAFLNSAIAHLYFETIHPYFDGNGRVGRALAKAALCRQLSFALPFSISVAVLEQKTAYYAALKQGSASLEINGWISFYLSLVEYAMDRLSTVIDRTQVRAEVFKQDLNSRQKKVLDKLFVAWPKRFEGGLSAAKYMKMTGAAKATATRDLQELLDLRILIREGSGRSTRYQLAISFRSNTA